MSFWGDFVDSISKVAKNTASGILGINPGAVVAQAGASLAGQSFKSPEVAANVGIVAQQQVAKKLQQAGIAPQSEAPMKALDPILYLGEKAEKYVFSPVISRPISTINLLSDPTSKLYQGGQFGKGFQLSDVKDAYNRTGNQYENINGQEVLTREGVSLGQSMLKNPFNLLGIAEASVLKANGVDVSGIDLWNDKDIQKNFVDNTLGKYITGANDFVIKNVAINVAFAGAGALAKAGATRAGLTTKFKAADVEAMPGFEKDMTDHIDFVNSGGTTGNKTVIGQDVIDLAASDNIIDIKRIVKKHSFNSQLPDLMKSTKDPKVVADFLLADKGYGPAIDRLTKLNLSDDLWVIGDGTASFRSDYIINGKLPEYTAEQRNRWMSAFDDAIKKEPKHQDIYDAFLTQELDETTGLLNVEPLALGKNYKPMEPKGLQGPAGAVRSKAGKIKTAITERDFTNPEIGGVAQTVLGGRMNGPVTVLLRQFGTYMPKGIITNSGLRPMNGVDELISVFDDVPLFRNGTTTIKTHDLNQMTVSDYRRNLIDRFVSSKTDGERADVIKNANKELARTIAYSRGYYNDAVIDNMVDELMQDVYSMHGNLRTHGHSMDPTGVRVSVDIKTQRQLQNSMPMLPMGDLDRMILRAARQEKSVVKGAITTGTQRTASAAKGIFESGNRIFSVAQLYRFSYIPKNSVFEPVLAATLAEGSKFAVPLFTSAAKGAIVKSGNFVMRNVEKSATLLPSAKKEIQREVKALSEEYNQAIIIRDQIYATHEAHFSNTPGVSPASKRDWADQIKEALREAERDVANLESKLNTYTIEYGKPIQVPSVYSLKSRIETLKGIGKQATGVELKEIIAPVITDENSIISLLNSQRSKGFTVEKYKQYEDSLINYTNGSGDYSLVNTVLRGGYEASAKETVKVNKIVSDLDFLISKAPVLETPITTFRGIEDTKLAAEIRNLKPGESFTDKAFSSTSLGEKTADRFARGTGWYANPKNGPMRGVIVEIVNPAGTKGIFPTGMRVEVDAKIAAGESEWLLPRNTKFTVTEVKGNNIKVIVSSGVKGGSLSPEAIAASRYASEIRSAELVLQKAVGQINTLAPELNVIDAQIAKAYDNIGAVLEKLGPKVKEQADIFSVSAGRYEKKPLLPEVQTVQLSNGQTLEFPSFASRKHFGEGYMSEIANNSSRNLEFLGNKATVAKITTVMSRSPKTITNVADPVYFDELAYVVNNHMRGDILMDRILSGQSRDQLLSDWATTGQARKYAVQMGRSPEELGRMIDESITYVNRYLPTSEAKLAAAENAVEATKLRGLLGDKLDQMVPIQPLEIEYANPTNIVAGASRAFDSAFAGAWRGLMKPENMIREVWGTTRHTTLVAERAERLLAQGYQIDVSTLNRIHHAAAIELTDEVSKVFYTIPRQQRALYLARALATFPNAAASGIYRYSRFAVQKPKRFAGFLNSYYGLYNSFGVDQNGNPVDDPMKAQYLLIPGTKEMGLNNGKGVIVNARATNYVANFPGATWMVPIALSKVYGGKPGTEEQISKLIDKTFGKIPGYSYEELFPYGIEPNTGKQLANTFTPAWARNLKTYLAPDKTDKMFVDSWISEANRQGILHDMGKGPAPTEQSIMNGARDIYFRKFRTQFFSLLGTPQYVDSRPDSLYQDYFFSLVNNNTAQGMSNTEAYKKAGEDFSAHMLKETGKTFPMDRLFVSSQKSITYITPSVKAYNRIWEDFPGLATSLRQVDPSTVGLMVADLPKEYSPQVNKFLNSTTARLPDGTMVNSALKTPQLVEEEIEKSRFWSAYTTEKNRLNKAAKDAGYASYLSVPELRDRLRAYANDTLGPASRAWYTEYQKGATKGNKSWVQAQGLFTVVNNKEFMDKFGKTQFWQHAKAFIQYRNDYAKAYADAPTGSKQLVKDKWAEYLASSYDLWDPTMQRMITRYFEDDNMRENK